LEFFPRTVDELSKKIPETDRALEKAKKDLKEIETTEKKASEEVYSFYWCLFFLGN